MKGQHETSLWCWDSCSVVLHDVTTEENLVEDLWALSVLFLTTACESIIISKQKVYLKIQFDKLKRTADYCIL